MVRGRFLVLEGGDGCGKSTQARRLTAALRRQGRKALHLREPGGTAIGEKIRRLLLDPRHGEMSVRAELLLYMASRAQLVEEVIEPALAQGVFVVCERFLLSSLVYQGVAGGLGVDTVVRIGKFATGGVDPDLTLLLDVDPRIGLSRVGKRPDRMEQKTLAFHQRVCAGFLSLARLRPRRVRIIDARADLATVTERVLAGVAPVLGSSVVGRSGRGARS